MGIICRSKDRLSQAIAARMKKTSRKEEEPRFHWHWQNLNDKPSGRQGWGIRHGRAWFHWGKRSLHVEWNLWSHFCQAILHIQDDDDDLLLALAVPPVALWIGESNIIPKRWLPHVWVPENGTWPSGMKRGGYWRVNERDIGIKVHHGTIRFSLWEPCMEWSSAQPWWWTFSYGWTDIACRLFGREQYSERVIDTVSIQIPMPEKSYPGTCKVFESTWKRPRWFPKRMVRYEIDVPGGVPFPGKGENSWDCGEDATFGLTCPASKPEQAVARFVESVLNNRRRYGGSLDWKPTEKQRGV